MIPDLLIIGGGPAGLATAILAGMRGMTSVVFEARGGSLDKACGEGIMPPGARLLQEMGVVLEGGRGRTFPGIRFIDGETRVEGSFPSTPGVAARRPRLIEAMLERTRTLPIDYRRGEAVEAWRISSSGVEVDTAAGVFLGRFLIGADGLRSRVGRTLAADPRPARRPRLGLRRHFFMAPWSSEVEVHFGDGVEAYVTPLPESQVGVALLASDVSAGFDGLLRRLPWLWHCLAGVEPASSVRGAGPFGFLPKRRANQRLALVGDAAGFIDPISGDGLTMTFAGAKVLADVLGRGAPLTTYEGAWRAATRRYANFTRLLLHLALRRELRKGLLGAISRDPRVFSWLLSHAVDESRLSDLPLWGFAKLLPAFLRGMVPLPAAFRAGGGRST